MLVQMRSVPDPVTNADHYIPMTLGEIPSRSRKWKMADLTTSNFIWIAILTNSSAKLVDPYR